MSCNKHQPTHYIHTEIRRPEGYAWQMGMFNPKLGYVEYGELQFCLFEPIKQTLEEGYKVFPLEGDE